jgi:hypothetical protein
MPKSTKKLQVQCYDMIRYGKYSSFASQCSTKMIPCAFTDWGTIRQDSKTGGRHIPMLQHRNLTNYFALLLENQEIKNRRKFSYLMEWEG